MSTKPRLIMSSHDARRLEALLASPAGSRAPTAGLLEEEIVRADIREPGDIPPDVVTMNSEVVCRDESSGAERRLRLVYPDAAGSTPEHISVLAPVGAALIGLSVGQSIDWPLPGGRSARFTVTEVLYQPEAEGRLD